jgi:hypothetical protein
MAQTVGGKGGWYVITWRPDPTTPFSVLVSQRPFPKGLALIDKGPFATQAAAQAWANTFKNSIVPGATNVQNPLTGIQSIGDFFGRLAEPATWVRVGEVVIGALALAIGMYMMVKDTGPVKATKAVGGAAAGFIPGVGGAVRATQTATSMKQTARSKGSDVKVTRG